jgi:glycosyltransferase involved in cell wall biosynthesis/peptidoglycan/xylan/chitin deacetylase (PgdA/CDA1 family)
LKSGVWRACCHVAFWTGAGPALAAWRRRRGRASWTLLTYHRIGDPTEDGGPDKVSRVRFRRQLRYVRRRYEVVPVGEALQRMAGGEVPSRPFLSITFDDGYRDNVTEALPILVQEVCRATLYPTVEAVRSGLAPWTHRLAVDLGAAAGSRRVNEMVDRAKRLPDADRQRLCVEADRISGGAGRRAAAMLRPEDLRAWAEAGMEIGSHTVDHRILSRMNPEDRRRDLRASRAALEDLAGAAVVHLAYPNGGSDDFDEGTKQDARDVGYHSAVTTVEGVNGPGFDRMEIRRIAGAEDSLPVFSMRISGLFSAMRRRLKGGATPREAAPRGLRIAFIGGRGVGSAYSGIERYYEEVGSRLVARGHRVVAYSRAHFTPNVESFRGVAVRRLPTLRLKHLETIVHSILATVDVCFQDIDLVQYHALGSSPLAWIPRLAGKRTVVSVRGLDWQRAKWGWLARTYLHLCEITSIRCPNATAVVSKTLARHYAEAHDAAVRYIPNGVERREACAPDAIRQFGLGHRDYFLYAGRLSPEKGLECLIQAHQRVASDALLVIAGGTSYSDRYIEQLRQQAGPRVVFTGFQTGQVLAELYANALAFVLPSHMEGLSVALLEALSYGLPVITSDIPENRELVEACGGHLFRTDDDAALATILRGVAADREGARRLGDAAREKVRRLFDWDQVAEETERFYLEVMGRTGVRQGTDRRSGSADDPASSEGAAEQAG